MDELSKYDNVFLNYALRAGIPFDYLKFKAQAIAESNLNATVKSNAGAIGIMQIMPLTGRDLGYSETDLLNPTKNIEAGITYMKKMFSFWVQKGGLTSIDDLWLFCLASYNAGPGNIKKAWEAAKIDHAEYYDWAVVGGLYLPAVTGKHAKETLNYVARVKRYYRALGGDI